MGSTMANCTAPTSDLKGGVAGDEEAGKGS